MLVIVFGYCVLGVWFLVVGNLNAFGKPNCVFKLGTKTVWIKEDFAMTVLCAILCVKGLEETKRLVSSVGGGIDIHLVKGDMDDSKGLAELCSHLLEPSKGKKYDQAILINNGGSLGDVTKPLEQFTDPSELQTFFGCNLTSPIVLTGKFIQHFSGTGTAIAVVNISSLCAIEPVTAMGVYCISKAARDMALKIYAKERSDVLCLNYAPGPMETAMAETLATEVFDEKIRGMFQKMKDEKTYVKVEESVKKLIGLLRNGGFESGSHIDFFDPDT